MLFSEGFSARRIARVFFCPEKKKKKKKKVRQIKTKTKRNDSLTQIARAVAGLLAGILLAHLVQRLLVDDRLNAGNRLAHLADLAQLSLVALKTNSLVSKEEEEKKKKKRQ